MVELMEVKMKSSKGIGNKHISGKKTRKKSKESGQSMTNSTEPNLGPPNFKKVKRYYKKKSKMNSKKPNAGSIKESAVQEKAGRVLSSNWQAFIKEVDEEKKKSNLAQPEGRGQKRRRPINGKQKTANPKRIKLESSKAKESKTIHKNDIWFDDVDIEDIEHATGNKVIIDSEETRTDSSTINTIEQNGRMPPSITKRLGIDCEMVGVGIDGKDNMLGRVSIVNSFGDTVYDSFVAPMQKVIDYRTEFSGIRPQDLVDAPSFKDVQREVANITNDKILIGHAIHNDLKVLLLSHPRKNIRDTSTYKPFKKLLKTKYPSLKKLTKEVLNVDIQSGEHSSVEDARCTMKIYQLHKKHWEKSLKEKGYKTVIENSPMIFMGKNSKEVRKRYRDRRIQREERKKKKKKSL